MGKAAREANAAKRAEAAHSRRQRARVAERRAKRTRLGLVIAIALLVVAGVAFTVMQSRGDKSAAIPAAASVVDGYGIVVNPDASPKIDLWEDPQCPACLEFERASGAFITSLARDGRAKVVFHPLTFIGKESVTAANAMACASDAGKFLEFHTVMYANQPAGENTGAWTTDAMINLGSKAGITSETFAQCVRSGKYEGWTQNILADGTKQNVNNTPTMLFNGEPVDRAIYKNPAALEQSLTSKYGMK